MDIVKPAAVKYAVRLLWLSILASAAGALCGMLYPDQFPLTGADADPAVQAMAKAIAPWLAGLWILVNVFLLGRINRARGWARIALFVLVVLELINMAANLIVDGPSSLPDVLATVLPPLLQLAAACLLLRLSAREWFAAHDVTELGG